MNALDTIRSAWLEEVHSLLAEDSALRRIRDGRIDRSQYAAMLVQLHLQVREHPQALASLALGLRGEARELVRGMLSHARAEAGHDLLALRDLEALGFASADVPTLRPLPATAAILGHLHRSLLERPALAFLGYLFHLEFLPTHFGAELGAGLLRAGIPPEAMTFLAEHQEADLGHNQLMGLYCERLLGDEAAVDEVVYAARVTARIYDRMLMEAIALADRPDAYGRDHREAAAEVAGSTR